MKKRFILEDETIPGLYLKIRPRQQVLLEDGIVVTNKSSRTQRIIISSRYNNMGDESVETDDVDGNTNDVDEKETT